MEQKEIKNFLLSLRDTDIEELKMESGKTQISFKRSSVPSVNTAAVCSTGNNKAKKANGSKEKKLTPITSHMVGTFYHSGSSDRPPFVIEGNHVVPGQKIGIIEAMKIMKDVSSDVKGKIIKVLVKNEQPVEYGQHLFLVDTTDIK